MLRSAATVAQSSDWEHEPVSLDRFITGRDFLANPPLSPIQYEAVRICERIYYEPAYAMLAETCMDAENRAYWAQPFRMVNIGTLEWGKGSGKDHICRIISLRATYLLLCLWSPLKYYTMPEQDTIHLINVASSAPQANRAFFTPLRRAVTRPHGWFAKHDYVHPLKGEIDYAKNVQAISGHSDAETQEGLNILVGVADEIDAFKTLAELEKHLGAQARESSRSAEGVLRMLRSSARTRFPQVFKNIVISWPRYRGSMIQQLIARGEESLRTNEKSPHFTSGPYCTWEVNPRVPGREFFQDDYDDDPLGSMARYECRPQRASNPYFSNEQAIQGCLRSYPQPPVTVTYMLKGNAWQPHFEFSPDFTPVRGAAYAMHADLAINGDRAGISIAHVMRWDEFTVMGEDQEGGEVEVTEFRPRVKVDAVFSFESDMGTDPPREIGIRWARLLFLELRRRGWNMRLFTADGFQSADTFQILEQQYGVETDLVSTDRTEEPWRGLKDLTSEDRIEWPGAKDDVVYIELLGLTRLPNGKVDHPNGGSKDLADALACSAQGAIVLGGREELDQFGRPVRAHLAPEGSFVTGRETLGDLPIGFIPPHVMNPSGIAPERVPIERDGLGRPVMAPDIWPDDPEEMDHWG